MSLPTCAVTCTMHGQDGAPEPGATFEFRLSRYEVYGGFVVPEVLRATADASGTCVVNLWPNQLGATESVYDVVMRSSAGRTQRVQAVVPHELTASLHDISILPTYPGKPDTQYQMEQAILARQDAQAALADTQTARDAAQLAETGSVAASGVSTTQAGIAADQAVIATNQAGVATAQAAIATTQAGIATTKAAEAAASVATATAHIADTANPHGTNKAHVGLSNVDNTSDLAKPVSTAQQAALNLKANLAGADFTGPVSSAALLSANGGVALPVDATGVNARRAEQLIWKVGGAARLPAWSTATRPATPSGGDIGHNATIDDLERWSAAYSEWVQLKRQSSGAISTATGTSHAITGIPKYATEVRLHLKQISTNGTSLFVAQPGTSAGLAATGYTVASSVDTNTTALSSSTAGVPIRVATSGNSFSGVVVFSRVGMTNEWIISVHVNRVAGDGIIGTGVITLADFLDRVGISCTGVDAFDQGTIWATWS